MLTGTSVSVTVPKFTYANHHESSDECRARVLSGLGSDVIVSPNHLYYYHIVSHMQIEFTLTIEADSPNDVEKIIEELEQREILSDSYVEYDEDWIGIEYIEYNGVEFHPRYSKEPNVPRSDDYYDKKFIISESVAVDGTGETSRTHLGNFQERLKHLVQLKDEIEGKTDYEVGETIQKSTNHP